MPVEIGMYANALAPVKSVQEYDNERMQGQQNRLSLALGQQKADEYTRGIADQNNLRQVVSQFGNDKAQNYNALVRAGRLTEAGTYQKTNTDYEKTQAETGEITSKTAKNNQETAGHQFEIAGQLAGAWATNPSITKQTIHAGLAAALHSGVISPNIAQAKMTELEQIGNDPASLNAWGASTVQQLMSAKDQIGLTRADANTVANNNTSLAVGAANNAVTAQGQRIAAGTAAAALAQRDRHFVATQASGKIPSGYRANPDGSMAFIPGGPGDPNASKEVAQKKSDAKDVLGLLDEADLLLPEATAGYVGAGVDHIARLAGSSLPGADAAAQLKTIQGALISKMPKMSGPQSDKDVLLYREMAGQVGDSTIPASQRQAAASMVRKLNEKYAGVPEGSSKKAPTPAGGFSDAAKEARYQAFKAGQK